MYLESLNFYFLFYKNGRRKNSIANNFDFEEKKMINNKNVAKRKIVDFNKLTLDQQLEKLKNRKKNYAKLMHDESDFSDKAWYVNEIKMIDLQIKMIKTEIATA